MRVLFLTHNFPRRSGDQPGNFLLKLAVALRADGVDVRVLAPHAPDLKLIDVVDGVPVSRFRYAPDERETLAYTGTMAQQVRGSMRSKLDLVSFIRSASRALRMYSLPLDVVHAHWWFPSGLAATNRARLDKPLVTTLHGSDVRFARGALGGALMARVLRRSARVTAVSHWLAAQASRRMQGRVPAVAPMPAATDVFVPGSVSRDGVLFVGKLDAQKGVHVLLEALVHVPQSITATIVGDGPDASTLRARAADLGVASRVRWMGALPNAELPLLYQQARLCIAPATEPEGLGLTAAEALLCETPVIASDIGGLPDLIDDGVTGRLVPPRDARALATAITDALGDQSRLEAWGREGRARVRARFEPSACAAQYRAIYEEAISGRPA